MNIIDINTKEEMPTNIYEQIKRTLAICETKEDYVAAYKWLAEEFVMVNESAMRFEEKAREKYGEKELGILIYGSEEAYNRELEYEKKLNNARTPKERETIALEKLLSEPLYEEPDFPVLWPEEDSLEEDMQLAQ